MNRVQADQEMLAQANELLEPMLAMAKGAKASAFSIAAIAVIKAYAETNPGIAPWLGEMLAKEGMGLLTNGAHQLSDGNVPVPMATASIH